MILFMCIKNDSKIPIKCIKKSLKTTNTEAG